MLRETLDNAESDIESALNNQCTCSHDEIGCPHCNAIPRLYGKWNTALTNIPPQVKTIQDVINAARAVSKIHKEGCAVLCCDSDGHRCRLCRIVHKYEESL